MDFLPAPSTISSTLTILSEKPILPLYSLMLKCEIQIRNPSICTIHSRVFISPLKSSHLLLFNPCMIFIHPWFIFINSCVLVVGVRLHSAIVVVSFVVTLSLCVSFSYVLNIYRLTICIIHMNYQSIFLLILYIFLFNKIFI